MLFLQHKGPDFQHIESGLSWSCLLQTDSFVLGTLGRSIFFSDSFFLLRKRFILTLYRGDIRYPPDTTLNGRTDFSFNHKDPGQTAFVYSVTWPLFQRECFSTTASQPRRKYRSEQSRELQNHNEVNNDKSPRSKQPQEASLWASQSARIASESQTLEQVRERSLAKDGGWCLGGSREKLPAEQSENFSTSPVRQLKSSTTRCNHFLSPTFSFLKFKRKV